MTAIQRDEVMDELEAECSCAREVLAAMQEQRDLARDLAIALEQALSEAEMLLGKTLTWAQYGTHLGDRAPWLAVEHFLRRDEYEAIHGHAPDWRSALLPASRLSGGEG